ncbi:MAG: type II toxin-antitoxin system HicA family toxin [Candidatus Magasanikbacteria bacterium]|nr:type II toxin-antitoxin system HicA family toxin [Candidatus Magasanikbacteria bacterium]
MPRLPVLTPAKTIRALERAGFIFIRQRGSHRIYVRGEKGVTIPFHNKDLRKGTLKQIIQQSGLTVEEFIKLL